eukprot:scaffold90216_cov78-Cyclotella_meneghiniana.AAC.4
MSVCKRYESMSGRGAGEGVFAGLVLLLQVVDGAIFRIVGSGATGHAHGPRAQIDIIFTASGKSTPEYAS